MILLILFRVKKKHQIYMLAPPPLDQTITYYYVHPSLLQWPCYNTVYQILTEQTNVVST